MDDQQENITDETAYDEVRARREFLKKCGKYAVVVPPAMVLLMTQDANGALVLCTSTIVTECASF